MGFGLDRRLAAREPADALVGGDGANACAGVASSERRRVGVVFGVHSPPVGLFIRVALGHHLENFFQWSRLHVLTVNLPVFWAPSRLRVFLVANGDVNGRAVIRIVAG